MKARRRLLALVMGLLCAALTACAPKAQVQNEAQTSAQTCEEIYAVIAEDQEFEEITVLSANQMQSFLDINEGLLADMVMGIDASRATPEMIVVLQANDEDALKVAQEALLAYLEATLDEYRDYRPEEMPKLENAVLRTKGMQTVLIVSKDAQRAEKALEKAWK